MAGVGGEMGCSPWALSAGPREVAAAWVLSSTVSTHVSQAIAPGQRLAENKEATFCAIATINSLCSID